MKANTLQQEVTRQHMRDVAAWLYARYQESKESPTTRGIMADIKENKTDGQNPSSRPLSRILSQTAK